MNNSEKDLLGILCKDTNWVNHTDNMAAALAICKAEYITTQEGQLLIHAIKKILAKDTMPGLLNIDDELQGKPIEMGSWFGLAGELAKNSSPAKNVIELANRVKNEHKVKLISLSLTNALNELNNPMVRNPKEKIKTAVNALAEIDFTDEEKSGYTSSEALSILTDKLEWLSEQEGDLSGIDTGFPRLNQITYGLQPSSRTVIAAQNGVGKTTLAMQMIEQAAFFDKKKVLFYSLEMPIDRVMMRFASSLSNVAFGKFLSGDVISDDLACKNFAAQHHLMNVDNLVIDDKPLKADDMEMRTKGHEFRLGGNIDMIVIDYFGMIGSSGFGEEAYNKIADAIDNLAKRFDCAVVTIAQLTKSFVGKPTRKDVRNGGKLCDSADFVGLLWRDTEVGEDFKDGDVLTFAVDKNRYGPITAFGFESALSRAKLIECEKPESQDFQPKHKRKKDFFAEAKKNAN